MQVETTGKRDKNISRRLSAEKVEYKFVISMPGINDLDPSTMLKEPIERNQVEVKEASKAAKSDDGLIKPETLTGPRQLTTEGPSLPLERLPKIRRKAVGSASNQKNVSSDTVKMVEHDSPNSRRP